MYGVVAADEGLRERGIVEEGRPSTVNRQPPTIDLKRDTADHLAPLYVHCAVIGVTQRRFLGAGIHVLLLLQPWHRMASKSRK